MFPHHPTGVCMSKCYYCNGTDKFCVECKRAAAKAATPSPNEVKTDYTAGVKRANEFVKKINEKAKAAPEKRYGWFSREMSQWNGIVIYSRPDGSEVRVTLVSDNPDEHGTGWKDIKFIGEVTEFVRKG